MKLSVSFDISNRLGDDGALRNSLHGLLDRQSTGSEPIDIKITDDLTMILGNHTRHLAIKGNGFDEKTMGDNTKPDKVYDVMCPAGFLPEKFINSGTQSACFSIMSSAGNNYVLKNEVRPGVWNADLLVYREFIGRQFMQYFDGKIHGPNIVQMGAKYIIETSVADGILLKRRVFNRLPRPQRDDITFAIAEMLYYMHFDYGKARRIIPALLPESFDNKPFLRHEYEPVVGVETADKFDKMMADPRPSFSQGDPHGENLILRPDGSLHIIDFGRCGLTDRRRDFGTLCDFFGKETCGQILENYVLMHECQK
jgi:hypothetical protein